MRKPKLSPADLENIKYGWADGVSIKFMAELYCRKRRTIKRIIAKMCGLRY